MLSEVINFIFKSKFRKRNDFFKRSIYWTSKEAGRRYFTKQSLVKAMSFLIKKCFFTIGIMVFRQDICNQWVLIHTTLGQLSSSFFESKHKQLISNGSSKAYK